jgi:hypothetical protein
VETRFHGDLVVDEYGSERDGHGCVSAHGYAYGIARPARVSVCVHAPDYDMHAPGHVCYRWGLVIRRVYARYGSYYVSNLYSHRRRTRRLVTVSR